MRKIYESRQATIAIKGMIHDTDLSGLGEDGDGVARTEEILAHIIRTRMNVSDVTIVETRRIRLTNRDENL